MTNRPEHEDFRTFVQNETKARETKLALTNEETGRLYMVLLAAAIHAKEADDARLVQKILAFSIDWTKDTVTLTLQSERENVPIIGGAG